MSISKTIKMAEISLSSSEIDAATTILKSGSLRQGVECEAFEKEFAKKVGAQHAIACANGSASLHLAYMTFLQPGDEVLVPSFTFMATGSMVMMAGGKPVICDVNPDTFLIDLEDAAKRITDKTRAISPVHLFGNVCDINSIEKFAKKYDLKVIWDNAQAHGAKYQNKDVGGFNDFTSYSFYPSKNLFVGEGGMILTNDEEIAYKLRYMRSHGQTGKYLHTMIGLNYRMTDVEAAIGREQLKRLDDMLTIRRRNYHLYNEYLSSIPSIKLQQALPNTQPAVHQYCFTINSNQAKINRNELIIRLKEKGIESGIHYPRGLHQQPIFIEKYGHLTLPVTERLCNEIIAIPVHHGLSIEDTKYITEVICQNLS
ncbi:polysaccharide biosynthesis protein [Legionella beliardensis]|uniref:Polysaccharide biosynthesis protein n=1 Tax=Legionella beliardensis TaxID=91822 RepID=A0A378I1N2_9GAMM|nr:DegT/DnrJ/EryC1/StrS family aminotransferase [Legionella beliardensis]STX28913.1 polysaccharide biosynthesis protein [Legionella beliardensis]